MIWWIGSGAVLLLLIAGIVIVQMKKHRAPTAEELLSVLRPNPGTLDESALRQNLRVKFHHQEEKVDAAIAFERQRDPAASVARLMQNAIERWERENR